MAFIKYIRVVPEAPVVEDLFGEPANQEEPLAIGDIIPADQAKIERDDTSFVEYFVKLISENPGKYALSKCVDELLLQENGAFKVMGILRLLNAGRSAFIGSLTEKTAKQLSRLTAKTTEAEPVTYEETLSTLHWLMTKFELERKIAAGICSDELFAAINNCGNTAFNNFFATAEPSDCSAIFAVLPPDRIQGIMDELSSEVKRKIYQGFSSVNQFTPAFVQAAAQKLVAGMQDGQPIVNGVNYILDILSNMADDDAKDFIDSLDGNQDLKTIIADRYVTPSVILRMDEKGVKSLFSEFDPKTTANFLYIAGEQIVAVVLPIQSARNQAIIKDTLAALQNTTKNRGQIRAKAEECKQLILDRLREMIAKKEISLAA